MGRSSTFGMRHLVKRPEGGFSYIRGLSVAMAESLSGELSLSWVADRRKVGGRKVLKVALGTGDLALARDRWLEVHSQVEHLVGFAKDNFQRRKPRPAVPRRVQSLSGEAIRDIADSVYRRILAADDDEALSGHHADLTELVLNEMAEMAVGEEPNAYEAKREAHLREYDHLRAHSRQVEHYDFNAEMRLPTVESLMGEGVAPANARSMRDVWRVSSARMRSKRPWPRAGWICRAVILTGRSLRLRSSAPACADTRQCSSGLMGRPSRRLQPRLHFCLPSRTKA